MLITCPKCGFQQPKDNYCANCGVNIEKYTPTKESFISKLSSSLFLQSLLVLSIALLGSYYYFQIQNEKKIKHIKQNTTFMSQTLKKESHQNNEPKNNSENSLSTTPSEVRKVEIPPLNDQQKNALVSNSTTAHKQAPPQAIPATTQIAQKIAENQIPKTTQLSFKFMELPTASLKRWIDLNRNSINGPIPKADIALLSKSRSLDTATLSLKNSSTEKISYPKDTTSETRSDMGLGFDLTLTKKDEKTYSLTILKRFHIKDESQSFTLDIPTSGPIYFYWDGLLKGFESYPELLSQNPFVIFNSEYYRTNKTELVLIIELDK